MKNMINDWTYMDIPCGNIEEVIAELTELQVKYPNGKIDLNSGYESISAILRFQREETDAEYNARLKSEAKAKEKAKKRQKNLKLRIVNEICKN